MKYSCCADLRLHSGCSFLPDIYGDKFQHAEQPLFAVQAAFVRSLMEIYPEISDVLL